MNLIRGQGCRHRTEWRLSAPGAALVRPVPAASSRTLAFLARLGRALRFGRALTRPPGARSRHSKPEALSQSIGRRVEVGARKSHALVKAVASDRAGPKPSPSTKFDFVAWPYQYNGAAA